MRTQKGVAGRPKEHFYPYGKSYIHTLGEHE